ncbi:MAG: HNH endonuclease signature motif containing protein [Acidimicrobiia bacterium]
MMLDSLRSVRSALEVAARDFDPRACSGAEAIAFVQELGAIRRLTDGMVGKAAKRVEDTAAYTYKNDRNAAELCERVAGVAPGEAKRAIEVAGKLEALPATDAAVRAGKLSARAAELIASAAAEDPAVERGLLKAATKGMVALRDACIAARAVREDQSERSARQHASRSFTMWSTADGMVAGRFQVTPEVGGAIKAKIEDGTRRRFREARSEGARESQDAYAADAFAAAVLGDPATGKGGGYTTHVVIDHEALVRGNALDGETCEIPGVGPVNAQWVRDLLGSAFVTAVVKKGKDITAVAHFGRHIPAELRTAMIVSGRECSIEGCSGREYLELDHSEIDHAKRGPTAWWNLIWLCSIHHTRKTQGWTLGPPDPNTRKRRLDPPPAIGRAA